MREDIQGVNQVVQSQHRKTEEQINQSALKITNAVNVVGFELESLRMTMTKASLAPTKSDRVIHFIGEFQEPVFTSLLLLKQEAHRAILHMLSHHASQVSDSHLCWLRTELAHLVSSATQELAACSQGSTATSRDHWTYSPKTIGFQPQGSPAHSHNTAAAWLAGDDDETQNTETRGTGKRKRLHSDLDSFSFDAPVGQLRISVPRSCKRSKQIHSLNEASLYFIPGAGVCSTSIAAHFVKVVQDRSEPRPHAQINAFRFIEADRGHREMIQETIKHGTLESIDIAIRNGDISPYDMVEDIGLILIWVSV